MTPSDHGSKRPDATPSRPRDSVERDVKVPGLMLRHRATRSSWHLYYRGKDGREHRPKIGDARGVSRAQARDIARQWLGRAAAGQEPNPAADRRTIADLRKRFDEVHAPKRKPGTAIMYGTAWNHILPRLGRHAVSTLSRRDVADFHHGMRAIPTTANRALAVLRKALNLAEVWGWRPPRSNPVYGIEFYREKKRRRYPAPDEIDRIIAALKRCDDPVFVGLVRLVAMTGCRPSEIRTARREWIKPEGLVLPDSKGGADVVALSKAARAEAAAMPVIAGNPYLVPGVADGRPMIGVGKKWRRLMKDAKVDGLQLRDLRRLYASVGLSEAGLSLEAVGQLLRHKQTQTTKVYAYLMTDARQAAAEAISKRLPFRAGRPAIRNTKSRPSS